MEISKLSKVVGTGVLIASLATLPAFAQSGSTTDSSQAAPGDTARYGDGDTDRGERSFDWGWIGLLGLVGLAGRLAKPHQVAHHTHAHETDSLGTTEGSVNYQAPAETNSLDTTEKSVRYRDPQGTNSLGNDSTNNR